MGDLRGLSKALDRASEGKRAAIERGIETIRAKEPKLDYAANVCLTAWNDLSTCRGIGMAMGPIPWTAMVAWCERRRLSREASDILIRALRQMDVDRAEREAATRTTKNAGGPR